MTNLGANDYWMRFEWQHRGSPNVHGLAWLPNALKVKQLLTSADSYHTIKQEIDHSVRWQDCNYDQPRCLAWWQLPRQIHTSATRRTPVSLILTRISLTLWQHANVTLAALQHTVFAHIMVDKSVGLATPDLYSLTPQLSPTKSLLTAHNDGMVNSFNSVQLSAWRANVDMHYIISLRKVVEYCTKYVTKSEPRSQSLKDIFTNVFRSLKDDNRSLKAVQKLLIHSVGERDYSA